MSLNGFRAKANSIKNVHFDEHAWKNNYAEKFLLAEEIDQAEELRPPQELKIRAASQRYDAKRKRFIAEGGVTITLDGGVLMADLVEFDVGFKTLYARGAVRFKKGANYFQGSSLRYNLLQKTGELKDVYGVLDLENPIYTLSSVGITPFSPLYPSKEISSNRSVDLPEVELTQGQKKFNYPEIACPAVLPPLPDWQPREWAVTGWGGEMIDSGFGDTFIFNGRLRRQYLYGIGLQKRFYRSGVFSLEFETDIFNHNAYKDIGGKYNQDVEFADLKPQNFGEGLIGIGARLWVRPWLSFAVTEGISYYSEVSEYERTFRKKYSQLLNYLAFEIEVSTSKNVSIVGRIHHRSGAFGIYNGAHGGGNGYLLGLRYRWQNEVNNNTEVKLQPPLGCKSSSRDDSTLRKPLSEELDSIVLGDGSPKYESLKFPILKKDKTKSSDFGFSNNYKEYEKLSVYEQEEIRGKMISRLDQRMSNIKFKKSFKIEKKLGVPESSRTRILQEEKEFGRVKPGQLVDLGRTKFISGRISRWRVQASRVILNADGWEADRMAFTNDPFTPAQSRIDAEGIIAREEDDGTTVITSKRNRLVLEDRLPIPVSRVRRFENEEEVENRWVVGFDYADRDGAFIGRNLKEKKLSENFKLSLQPQVNLERSIDGNTQSYVSKDDSVAEDKILQKGEFLDNFGLESNLSGKVWGWGIEANSDISTFSPNNFLNGSRHWGDISKLSYLPLVGEVETRFFSAYRYRAWNGSLGETDIYTAYGAFLQKSGRFKSGNLTNNLLVRVGSGRYQAEKNSTKSLTDLWRGNIYASLSSGLPLWSGKTAPLTPDRAYRYSPVPITPGVALQTNLNTSLSTYGDGKGQSTLSFSGGPAFTIGRFDNLLLSYSKFSLIAGGTLKSGASPFSFDQAVDLGTLGLGVAQQIYGPLILDIGIEYNIDSASSNYGQILDSNIELRYQRRAYDFGLYFNPYKRIGGFRIRLNDFSFDGTGIPFVPYNPTKMKREVDKKSII